MAEQSPQDKLASLLKACRCQTIEECCEKLLQWEADYAKSPDPAVKNLMRKAREAKKLHEETKSDTRSSMKARLDALLKKAGHTKFNELKLADEKQKLWVVTQERPADVNARTTFALLEEILQIAQALDELPSPVCLLLIQSDIPASFVKQAHLHLESHSCKQGKSDPGAPHRPPPQPPLTVCVCVCVCCVCVCVCVCVVCVCVCVCVCVLCVCVVCVCVK